MTREFASQSADIPAGFRRQEVPSSVDVTDFSGVRVEDPATNQAQLNEDATDERSDFHQIATPSETASGPVGSDRADNPGAAVDIHADRAMIAAAAGRPAPEEQVQSQGDKEQAGVLQTRSEEVGKPGVLAAPADVPGDALGPVVLGQADIVLSHADTPDANIEHKESETSASKSEDSHPSYGVYRGSDEIDHHRLNRGFTEFGHHIKMVFPETPSLDSLIEGRIEQAQKQGRDVVVIDLGGGTGNFTRQPLVDQAVLSRSRKKLSGQSVDTRVRFYSVTDATSEQKHLQITPFSEADNPGNEQLAAQEVNYSITSSQNIKKLLEGLQEDSADIIVASNFMQYLHPKLFESTLQDIVDALKPGGRFMAFGYATLAGRHLSVDDGYAPEDYPVVFQDPKKPDDAGVPGNSIREWGELLLSSEQTTDEQLIEAIDRIQEIMFASDYYAQPVLGDFRGKISRIYHSALRDGESPRFLFSGLLNDILPIAEENVRIEKIKVVKDRIINDLAKRNATVASIQHRRIPNEDQGLDAIIIQKSIEGQRMQRRTHSGRRRR